MLTIAQFKDAIRALILAIIAKADAKSSEAQLKIVELSDKLTKVTADFDALKLTADNAAAEAVAANLKELDELSTQLAAEFNPTPAADAAVEVTQQVEVIESIDPTDIIEGADPVGEPVATPLPVIEAAVDAVVAVDEAVVI